mmetsp:Transcript_31182/g.93499  ORF Transcript_31182/g.93499 Transcript_31182/m.93499 type:complete len:285 (+) Transcript_31182:633-1487(+)
MDPTLGVLEHETLRRIHVEPPGRLEVHVRGRLALLDRRIVAADYGGDASEHSFVIYPLLLHGRRSARRRYREGDAKLAQPHAEVRRSRALLHLDAQFAQTVLPQPPEFVHRWRRREDQISRRRTVVAVGVFISSGAGGPQISHAPVLRGVFQDHGYPLGPAKPQYPSLDVPGEAVVLRPPQFVAELFREGRTERVEDGVVGEGLRVEEGAVEVEDDGLDFGGGCGGIRRGDRGGASGVCDAVRDRRLRVQRPHGSIVNRGGGEGNGAAGSERKHQGSGAAAACY